MSVYTPREDSFFLRDFIAEVDLESKKVLDMGTGSGILAICMARQGADVTAVDIDEDSVRETRRKAEEEGVEIEVKNSDLFENVEGSYDLIVFNPPYLPDDGFRDENLHGGVSGTELAREFLESVGDCLEDGGEAFILISSLSEPGELIESFELEVVETKELWFETLYITSYR